MHSLFRLPKIGAGELPCLLVFAASLLICGCGHPVQETAAHKIADALPAALGPAAHYDVQVDGDPFALARGRAHAVHVQGEDVQLSPSLTLDTLSIDASDVSFDTQTRRLSHIGGAAFTASLGQTHLDRYLARSKPLLPGLVVTLLPNTVEARVPVSFLGLRTVAALSGSLRPDAGEPDKLDFVTSGAQIGTIPLPAGLVNLALDSVNPVLDLSGLNAPLSVTETKISGSRLYLSGQADLGGLVSP